jgi:restriction endonuclease Mrr
MRALLGELDSSSGHNLIDAIASGFFRLKGPIDKDKVDEKKAKQLLHEFRMTIGDDPIEAEIQRRERDKAKLVREQSLKNQKEMASRLQSLNDEFMVLVVASEITPQQRGFRLEKLFFDLLSLSDIEHSRPYRTSGGEQIDGHFRYEKFDYLVEAKWTKEPAKQPEMSIFDGKIRGKAQSTRGLFISSNDFDLSAVQKYSGDSPRIILMTGEDLALVLSGRIHFSDVLKAKVDAIVRQGVILLKVRDFAT